MPITVKTSLSKAKETTTNVSAVDSETLIAALDKLDKKGHWGKYVVDPSAVLKLTKDKKVSEVTIKAQPKTVLPVWKEYSKTTKARQAEWDKMVPKLKKYLTNQHNLFLEAVAKFAVELKPLDLDKAGFNKLWKTKKAEIAKINVDYADKTTGGYSLGVDLEIIGPDPVEGASDIKSPKTVKYNVGGKTIKAVFKALNKRKNWGYYNPHSTPKMDTALDGKVSKITVKAVPTIDMPKWTGYGKGNDAQKATWDDMWTHLLAHENKHHKKFTDAVKAYLKEIKDMDMTKAEALVDWDKKNDEWQVMQDKFDDATDHGANQGVMLDASADP